MLYVWKFSWLSFFQSLACENFHGLFLSISCVWNFSRLSYANLLSVKIVMAFICESFVCENFHEHSWSISDMRNFSWLFWVHLCCMKIIIHIPGQSQKSWKLHGILLHLASGEPVLVVIKVLVDRHTIIIFIFLHGPAIKRTFTNVLRESRICKSSHGLVCSLFFIWIFSHR